MRHIAITCLCFTWGLAAAAHADGPLPPDDHDPDANLPDAKPGPPGASPSSPSAPSSSPPPTASYVARVPEQPPSGPRFRNGFSASVGEEVGSGPSAGLTGQLYGMDWRIGAQLIQALGLYLDTHVSFGTAHIGAVSGLTGDLAVALLAEYTIARTVFVAGGGGYGVLNNPSGPLAQVRVGVYPMPFGGPGKQRHLDLAVDARLYFAGDQIGTVTQVALTLGYDRF
jgi:hypothetical protein